MGFSSFNTCIFNYFMLFTKKYRYSRRIYCLDSYIIYSKQPLRFDVIGNAFFSKCC
jgi:hypothetical protein